MLQHLLDPNPPSATQAHREAVRRRAAVLTRNRRLALATGLCALAAVSVVSIVLLTDDATTTRTIDPADTPTTTAQPRLPDDAPLFEGPIPTVALTPVLVDGPITLSFESSPEQGVGLRFQHADSPGYAGLRAEPQHLRAISNGGVQEGESLGNWAYRYGVTRADIVRIILRPAEGAPVTVYTVAHPAAPGVRFFVIEEPGLRDPGAPVPRWRPSVLYGYDAQGRLVSDTAREWTPAP